VFFIRTTHSVSFILTAIDPSLKPQYGMFASSAVYNVDPHCSSGSLFAPLSIVTAVFNVVVE
jgi:hypothetical protein